MKENKNIKSLWIARDKDGSLFLYNVKPILHSNGLDFDTKDEDDDKGIFKEDPSTDYEEPCTYNNFVEINDDDFPDVTFENSPVEFVLKDQVESTDYFNGWKTATEARDISRKYQEKRIKEAIEDAIKDGRKEVSLSKTDDFSIDELDDDLKRNLESLGYRVVPSWTGSNTITIKW